ncbi:hypothetical protein BpHYR1_001238 [Brachionus plicatilis]|uniref:Uncharacterized protein n=1 Tax=Brachionus plicatilis TaxID=10195 RepID=A0A3M7S5E3_BRAPC|nr:hypothetical protein BpHYR1_001238 [Brachionus plicatilis]
MSKIKFCSKKLNLTKKSTSQIFLMKKSILKNFQNDFFEMQKIKDHNFDLKLTQLSVLLLISSLNLNSIVEKFFYFDFNDNCRSFNVQQNMLHFVAITINSDPRQLEQLSKAPAADSFEIHFLTFFSFRSSDHHHHHRHHIFFFQIHLQIRIHFRLYATCSRQPSPHLWPQNVSNSSARSSESSSSSIRLVGGLSNCFLRPLLAAGIDEALDFMLNRAFTASMSLHTLDSFLATLQHCSLINIIVDVNFFKWRFGLGILPQFRQNKFRNLIKN